MIEKFDKLQEPPKAKTKKALPIPEEKKRSKRGGKRVRRWKERFAMTAIRFAFPPACCLMPAACCLLCLFVS